MTNITFQKLIPKKLLGKLCILLSQIRNTHVKNLLISIGIYFYKLNMQEALLEDPYAYTTIEKLFIRKLKPDARIFDKQQNTVCSPCDGLITQINLVNSDSKVKAKDHFYTLDGLLANKEHCFQQGLSTTIYLAPTDYHRVHMPMSGQITSMVYIPGKLYSVNPKLYEKIPTLLSSNERVIINAKNDLCSFALVLIGALNVGHIHINWHGIVNPYHPTALNQWKYQDQQINLSKGDELGYFTFGSTVIMLIDQPTINPHENLRLNQQTLLGKVLAEL